MEMMLFLLGLYLLLIAPVQVGLMAEWGPGRNAAHVGVMVWGFRKVFHFPLKRNEEGLLYLETPFPRGRRRRKKEKKKDWLSLVIRLLHLRKEKHAFVRLRLLKVQAYVSLPDAAQTAVMCGFLSLLLGALFPHGQSRFIPAYHGRNLGRAACIAEGRLGTIGLVYLMWKKQSKKEETTWNIPSPS